MPAKGPFARAFSNARMASEWTQQELATSLGMSNSQLGRIERGSDLPLNADRIKIACDLLEIPEQTRYFQLLAEWERFMRKLPIQAISGWGALEALGEAFARGKMDGVAWRRLELMVVEMFEEEVDGE